MLALARRAGQECKALGLRIDALEAEGDAVELSGISTTGFTDGRMVRIASGGGIEERTTAQVLSDIGAAASGHTHAQLHDAATVSGNGIQISGQQISLTIGTGSNQVAAGNHTHTAAEVGALTKFTAENLDVHDALLSTGGMVWSVGAGGGAVCTDLKNTASFSLNSLAASAWTRINWGFNNIGHASSGQCAHFGIKSEISGMLFFRTLSGAACRVLGWDTSPATPYNFTQNAFTNKGVGFELYESGGNLVGRIVRHDGTTYRNSGTDFIVSALPVYAKNIVFRLIGNGIGEWGLYLQSFGENETPGMMELPLVASITDGPTGSAVIPSVGPSTTVAIVSADGATAYGSAVSGYARKVLFRKFY